ncbi:MAG: cytochrome C oxidase subunit IV family protein [Novosphingobium sp.]|nr:cytochrome C oxidase subunit IV family protein [Novosphingobium sp.]
MMDRLERRLLICWTILMVATVGSFQTTGLPNTHLALIAVLLITFSKVLLVIFVFMEVRCAPLGLKLPLVAWAIVVPLGLSAVWFTGQG